jgi:hypothetical protein
MMAVYYRNMLEPVYRIKECILLVISTTYFTVVDLSAVECLQLVSGK